MVINVAFPSKTNCIISTPFIAVGVDDCTFTKEYTLTLGLICFYIEFKFVKDK